MECPYKKRSASGSGREFPLGFVMLSLLLLLIGALHGFSIDGVGVGGTAALSLAILYFIGFIFVGMFEEFSFRGYMQSTLAFRHRILAGGDHSLDRFRRDSPWEHRRSEDRRIHGGMLRTCRRVCIASNRKHLVSHRDARFLGLGRNVFLRHSRQRHSGTGAFPQLVIPRAGLVDGRKRRARRQLVSCLLVMILWAIAIHFLFPAKPAVVGQTGTDTGKAFAARPEF